MDTLVNLINSFFPEPHASLINGILLGRTLFVTNGFYNSLKAVGLIHIVVLSGMNITLLSAIIIRTLVNFVDRKLALIITIVIVILFVLFVGAEPPIIRAAIMGILSMIGLVLGRKTSALYILFISAIIMVIVNHDWLTSISFQLSFSATLGIILFGKIDIKSQDDKSNKIHSSFLFLNSYLLDEFRISLSAQIFTLPIIFWYFRQISVVSPIANVLVAWMIAPIMILGFITVFLGFINWNLGFIFSWLLYPLLGFIVWIVETLSRLPYASIKL